MGDSTREKRSKRKHFIFSCFNFFIVLAHLLADFHSKRVKQTPAVTVSKVAMVVSVRLISVNICYLDENILIIEDNLFSFHFLFDCLCKQTE